MCRLAISGDDFFEVDDLEVNRPGSSYTIDTARILRAGGNSTISWLIGADMVNSLPTWHDPAALLEEVNFVLMARPGWIFDWSSLPVEMQSLQSQIVPAPQLQISSTVLRSRIAVGKSIRYLTPDAVIDYIRQHRLYSE
jgi:nicotinate-nucleotide adenylyltransferase